VGAEDCMTDGRFFGFSPYGRGVERVTRFERAKLMWVFFRGWKRGT